MHTRSEFSALNLVFEITVRADENRDVLRIWLGHRYVQYSDTVTASAPINETKYIWHCRKTSVVVPSCFLSTVAGAFLKPLLHTKRRPKSSASRVYPTSFCGTLCRWSRSSNRVSRALSKYHRVSGYRNCTIEKKKFAIFTSFGRYSWKNG